jgi:hypothetical protein
MRRYKQDWSRSGTDWWQALVNAVMKLQDPWNRDISWLGENMFASQEGLCSIELDNCSLKSITCTSHPGLLDNYRDSIRHTAAPCAASSQGNARTRAWQYQTHSYSLRCFFSRQSVYDMVNARTRATCVLWCRVLLIRRMNYGALIH